MMTITGKLEDATGAPLHAQIDFVSTSTPLVGAGGVVTTNTDDSIKSNPGDGTFSLTLAPGNYNVSITANGETTNFTIAVPNGNGTATIDTLVTTPLAYTQVAPAALWNGIAQNITFAPTPNPVAPTTAEVAYTGGNAATVASHYAYWVSYVTATGQTALSPQVNVAYASVAANQATRIFLTPNVSGVTAINIWRTYVDTGSAYAGPVPLNVGLLATVGPSTAYYDDWESTAQFASRVTTMVPPMFNSTAGTLFGCGTTPAMYVNLNGIFIAGANCRFKPGVGIQIYNFTTQLWHTLLCVGSPAQLALDAGNPN